MLYLKTKIIKYRPFKDFKDKRFVPKIVVKLSKKVKMHQYFLAGYDYFEDYLITNLIFKTNCVCALLIQKTRHLHFINMLYYIYKIA